MGFIVHREAPKVKLVTMGQADKEIEMTKGVSFETHPDLYHLRPGTTEPELKNPSINSTLGADVVSKETVKSGPVGAKGEPKAATKKAAKAPAAKK